MLRFLLFVTLILAIQAATDVRRCAANKPFPLEVRVKGCEKPPCDVIKGTDVIIEIDFVANKHASKLTTLVKATTLGITVPYELPEEVRDVCSNLLYGAYCPLYATEDVTYLFIFPIGTYPEIGVRIEVYIVDQDKNIQTCFQCDIKVKKGQTSNSTRSTGSIGSKMYQLNWLKDTY